MVNEAPTAHTNPPTTTPLFSPPGPVTPSVGLLDAWSAVDSTYEVDDSKVAFLNQSLTFTWEISQHEFY